MSGRKKITVGRSLLIYATGLVTGVQVALYLYDYYDDGSAEITSLLIGLFFLLLSLLFVFWTHRSRA